MRRRLLESVKDVTDLHSIKPSEAEACDVVFANKETEELIIAREWDENIFPPDKYEPIGIVVIPGSHGVLKDGSGTRNQCGVISLRAMNPDFPEDGKIGGQQVCYWGKNNTNIANKSDGLYRYDSTTIGLKNYAYAAADTEPSNTAKKLVTFSGGWLPEETSSNSSAIYRQSTTFITNYFPSPYLGEDLKSGGYNENYGTTKFDTSSKFNALADFGGIVNTKIITDLATAQKDWRTADTIISDEVNNSTKYYYPTACCCARYKTLGTKAFVDCTLGELNKGEKFWYLPAIGELGYLPMEWRRIKSTASRLKTKYNNFYNSFDYTEIKISSSSENSTSTYLCVAPTSVTDDGSNIVSLNKSEVRYIVDFAFMRLGDQEQPDVELTDSFTLDQSISDPAKMLTGTLGKNGTPETNIVSWIRANSHRYLGTYDSDKGMILKQLDDNNSNKYADGTDTSTDIQQNDVFMKMPTFWYKGTPLDSNNMKYNIHFTNKEPTTKGWTKWDGNTLIGVYECWAADGSDNELEGLYSLSTVIPNTEVSQDNFKLKARNRSNGIDHFMLVTYEAHQVMALLYMCYYGNMNGQAVCGSGTSSSYPKMTGASNSLGMRDTTASTSLSLKVVNFWGLENWWGNICEYVDNLKPNGGSESNSGVAVLDYDGNIVRTFQSTYDPTYIKEMALGEKLDMLPAPNSGSATKSTYYCDYGFVFYAPGYAFRSDRGSTDYGGPFNLVLSDESPAFNFGGSRLLYQGRVTIE